MHIPKLISAALFLLPLYLNAEEVLDQNVRDEAKALIAQSFQSDLGYQIIESLTTEVGQRPVSYTHLTLPTNREV